MRITGQAALRLAGQEVDLLVRSRGNRRKKAKRVGSVEVRPDGTFAARVRKPPKRIRTPEYLARAGTLRSKALELDRRMYVDALSVAAGQVTLRGHVTRPLPPRGTRVNVVVQTDCRTRSRVARVKLKKRRRFRATFPAPSGVAEILVRADTRVPVRRKIGRRGGQLAQTFTLPAPLELG